MTTSDSFTPVITYWTIVESIDAILAPTDSLNIQMSVIPNTYYYATINLSTASTTVGYIQNGLFTGSSGLVTNVDSLTDGQTTTPANFSASNYAGVRFDMGSQTNVDFICIHLQSGIGDAIKFYGSNSQGSNYSQITTPTNSNTYWTINTFTNDNYRY